MEVGLNLAVGIIVFAGANVTAGEQEANIIRRNVMGF